MSVTKPEYTTVEVVVPSRTAGESASSLTAGLGVNWLPTARAVPPMTNVATTIARMVVVRVLT